MAGERRKYLRVLFEETIQVECDEWTDPMATGLDISLNGTRFHCEHSLSEGATVVIGLRPELRIEAVVRWSWPIEWYYQAAVEFNNLDAETRTGLRNYITETTGEPYPEYEDEPEETEKIASADAEDGDDAFLAIDDDDSSSYSAIDNHDHHVVLTPTFYEGRNILIVDSNEEQANTIQHYLTQRNHFQVKVIRKKSGLWPVMKAGNIDMVIIAWDIESEDPMALFEEIHENAPHLPIIFLAGVVSLETRLEALNSGAADFLTKPIHLSGISQAILKIFAYLGDSAVPEDYAADEEEDNDMDLGLDEDVEVSEDFLSDDFKIEEE